MSSGLPGFAWKNQNTPCSYLLVYSTLLMHKTYAARQREQSGKQSNRFWLSWRTAPPRPWSGRANQHDRIGAAQHFVQIKMGEQQRFPDGSPGIRYRRRTCPENSRISVVRNSQIPSLPESNCCCGVSNSCAKCLGCSCAMLRLLPCDHRVQLSSQSEDCAYRGKFVRKQSQIRSMIPLAPAAGESCVLVVNTARPGVVADLSAHRHRHTQC